MIHLKSNIEPTPFNPSVKKIINSCYEAHDFESLKEAFSVLNRERNNVAHGTNSTLSFNDMKDRFSEAIQIIEILDTIMV